MPGQALPETVLAALQRQQVPPESVAIFVQRVDGNAPLLSHQADVPMNPASTMKLLTTYAGLSVLGPAYRWQTSIYANGPLRDGVLQGSLILQGGGDPALMSEDYWRLLGQLRQLGVQDIRGGLAIDSTRFAPIQESAASFDGEGYRAYNAQPNAMLVNLKSTSFHFQSVSLGDTPQVAVTAEPLISGIRIVNRLQPAAGACGAWRDAIRYHVLPDTVAAVPAARPAQWRVEFDGSYAAGCGDRYLELSLLDDAAYTYALFSTLWQQLGGSIAGGVQAINLPADGSLPAGVHQLTTLESPALADVVRRINKYSNNLMARQLLLTLGNTRVPVAATPADGAAAVQAWLSGRNMAFPELVIENGAGLSRVERLSARHMAALLLDAYASPVMPEFMSSLPVLGVDGTVARRLKTSPATGKAHLKTGSLNGVSALAGYVLDAHGRRWVLVFFANHPTAAASREAQDALVEWVYAQP